MRVIRNMITPGSNMATAARVKPTAKTITTK
jgi:hypothetical protein